ncbi:MAG: SH3 domain-containing protein [Treponema sp.]
MEKNAAQSSTCYQRLLAAGVWLLLVVLLPAVAYGSQPQDISLSVDTDTVYRGQTITVTLTVSNIARKKRDRPQLQLQELNTSAELEQSSSRTFGTDLRIEHRYRMQKTGTYTVHPVVQWQKRSIMLDSFSIHVIPPPLSAHTHFEWFIFQGNEDKTPMFLYDSAGTPTPENVKQNVEQGMHYFLYITAVFSLPKAAEAVQNSVFLHNPPPITKIECGLPANALLSRLDFSDPDISLPTPVFEEGRFVLAAFEWIPLHTGEQPLPTGKIYFSQENAHPALSSDSRTVSSVETRPVFCMVRQSPLQPAAAVVHPAHAAFINTEETVAKDMDTALLTADEINAIHALAACRRKEIRSLYPFRVYAERRKLEQTLQIPNPLPVYPRGWWIMCICAAAVGIAGSIVSVFRKRWVAVVGFCTAVVCCSIAAAVFYKKNTTPQGVCIAAGWEVPIRRIPEAAGSSLYAVRAGESLRILRNTADWYYIKTADDRTGWIPQRNLLVYNERCPRPI